MGPDYLRLFDATVRLEMSLWADVESAVVAECGLKLGSVMALRAITARGDGVRVQDLAEDLGITVGAASKIVDRLEGARLVRRQPHATDGRSHIVSRTASGVSTTTAAITAMQRTLRARVAPALPAAQVAVLAQALDTITAGTDH